MNSTSYKQCIINNKNNNKNKLLIRKKSLMCMRNKSSAVPEAYLGTLISVEYFIAMNCVSYHCNVELLISNHVRLCL